MSIFGKPLVCCLRHNSKRFINMQRSLFGAIDAGTTSTRMIVFDDGGNMVCSSQHRIPLHSPFAGWAEQSPLEILDSVRNCMDECGKALDEMGLLKTVKAIGLAVHRESTVAVDADSGEPVSPIILWMDTRTKDLINSYQSMEPLIKQKTGLRLSTYFSALKMRWLIENGGLKSNFRFSTVDSFLLEHLTGKYLTDVTNASRTMLMNIRLADYDEELLQEFEISRDQLPEIRPSISMLGSIRAGPFKGVPITSVIGDQQASMYGHKCLLKGSAKCTIGTGAFLLANMGNEMIDTAEFISTRTADGHFALEVPIAMAGSGINWFQEQFNLPHEKWSSSEDVMFVPALTGLLSPFWAPAVKASFHNISLSTTTANMGAAVMESIAFSIAMCLKILKDSHKVPVDCLKLDGGLSKNCKVVQTIADCSGVEMWTSDLKECTAMGVAMGAAHAIGESIDFDPTGVKIYTPERNDKLRAKYEKWLALMKTIPTNMTPAENGKGPEAGEKVLSHHQG